MSLYDNIKLTAVSSISTAISIPTQITSKNREDLENDKILDRLALDFLNQGQEMIQSRTGKV